MTTTVLHSFFEALFGYAVLALWLPAAPLCALGGGGGREVGAPQSACCRSSSAASGCLSQARDGVFVAHRGA